MADPIQLDSIVRGDYEILDLTIENPPDDTHDDYWPRNIATDTLKFIAKTRLQEAEPVFSKSSLNVEEIEKVDVAGGVARVILTGDETGTITRNMTLKCILEVEDVFGRKFSTFYDLPIQWRS